MQNNLKDSKERFNKWKEVAPTLTKYELACGKSAWQAQEEYWSKRYEELRVCSEALRIERDDLLNTITGISLDLLSRASNDNP